MQTATLVENACKTWFLFYLLIYYYYFFFFYERPHSGFFKFFFSAQDPDLRQKPNQFWPTYWCLRIVSLKTVLTYYIVLIEFLNDILKEKNENGAKASGFFKQIMKLNFLFLLNIIIRIFDKIEILYRELQKVSLCFQETQYKINNVMKSIQEQQNCGFDYI